MMQVLAWPLTQKVRLMWQDKLILLIFQLRILSKEVMEEVLMLS